MALEFGNIFVQALNNSMAEKKAERKWNQQLDFQNTQLKQQKELADREFTQKQNIFDTEQKNWKFVNEMTLDANDPLVSQYGLAEAGRTYNPTERQHLYDQQKTYDQYLTDIGRNYKFYSDETALRTDLEKQLGKGQLLETALGKAMKESAFLSPQEKYALKMFKPNGGNVGVYDMPGEQYFLPIAGLDVLTERKFQADQQDLTRKNNLAAAYAGSAGTIYATNYQKERDAKTPIGISYKTLDGKERVYFGTQAEFDSGKWVDNVLGDKKNAMATLKDGRKVKYGDWFKEKNKNPYIIASGHEMVATARRDTEQLAKIDYVKKNYNISADSIKDASNWDDDANLAGVKSLQGTLGNVNSYLTGSGLSFYDINTNQALAINNKLDAQLRALYEKVTNKNKYNFTTPPTYHNYEWLLELNDENYKIAKSLLDTRNMVFGKAVSPSIPNPQQTVDFFRKQTFGE